ncbi:GbsR/MarR family transcriptional regulator [Marinicrinis lubricantis]|uniref:HTH-type transcriptional regulator n=1 Tax=Marinicrinis lubricantis TaxID=2086470 RepID=A0ABW1INQ1_9BACL
MTSTDSLAEEQQIKLNKARHRVIETVGKNMELYGVTMSIGHLYGEMFFKDHPVTLDEMGQVMGMSKTSMSTGMRALMDLKMVNKVWEKGSRKDLYEVEWDWYQSFADYFSIKWRKLTEMNMQALKRSMKEIESLLEECTDNADAKRLLELDLKKMKEAIQYYKWLGRLIDSLEEGTIFDFLPRVED